MRLGDQGYGCGTHGKRQHEGDDAVGADLMIAHDGEAALFTVAAKAVGEVGKPVLVQRSGREDHGEERADRGKRRRNGERVDEPVGRATDDADDGANHGIGPHGL